MAPSFVDVTAVQLAACAPEFGEPAFCFFWHLVKFLWKLDKLSWEACLERLAERGTVTVDLLAPRHCRPWGLLNLCRARVVLEFGRWVSIDALISKPDSCKLLKTERPVPKSEGLDFPPACQVKPTDPP